MGSRTFFIIMSLALDDEVLNPAASNSTKMELMLRARTARERSVTAPTSLAGNASKIAPRSRKRGLKHGLLVWRKFTVPSDSRLPLQTGLTHATFSAQAGMLANGCEVPKWALIWEATAALRLYHHAAFGEGCALQ
jgi:hypothetical protein